MCVCVCVCVCVSRLTFVRTFDVTQGTQDRSCWKMKGTLLHMKICLIEGAQSSQFARHAKVAKQGVSVVPVSVATLETKSVFFQCEKEQ